VPTGFLLLASALTHIHPGSGRAPGIVDSPVQKDPYNYPILMASSAKGALKSFCIRRSGALKNDKCLSSDGRIRCEDCESAKVCCCFFGSEPQEEAQTSLLSILDFVPLTFPVPSANAGYVYVTTPMLLRRASQVVYALELHNYAEALEKLADMAESKSLVIGSALSEDVDIAGATLEFNRVELSEGLKNLMRCIEELKGLASVATKRLVVVSDGIGASIVDKALIRLTRIRLQISKKTVMKRALWTEEYIPSGTIFISGLVVNYISNKYCGEVLGEDYMNKDNLVSIVYKKLKGMLGEDEFMFFVGGKESIGRGLIKVKIYYPMQ